MMQCLLWLATGLLAASAARAQDYDTLRLGSAPPAGGRVSAALIAGQAYKGSDERKTSLLPLLEYRWANGFFAGVGSGVGYEFVRESGLNAGVRLSPDFGRKESRSSALTGMGDIGRKLEIGAYVNYALPVAGLGLHASTRYGAGGDGLTGDLGISYAMSPAPALRLRLGAAATLANGSYMQTFFGVDDTQAANTPYDSFRAGTGVRDTRLSASLLYVISPQWAMTGSLTASQLHGDAANSPLTRDRSALTAVVSISYGF